MKMNWSVRFQNPWFWIGLVSVLFTATGLEPSTFTSWPLVWQAIRDVLSNPFQLATAVLAVLAVFVDPTTAGLGDSAQALSYSKPAGK